MKHYILFHAKNDAFLDKESMLAAARQREGFEEGCIICFSVNLVHNDDMTEELEAKNTHAFIVESGPVAVYGAPATSEESVSTEFPGKIKEWNLRHTGHAYKDAPIVEKLRKTFSPEQICEVLNILEATNAAV